MFADARRNGIYLHPQLLPQRPFDMTMTYLANLIANSDLVSSDINELLWIVALPSSSIL